MIKKFYFFPLIILGLILIAGCGGGGPAPNDTSNPEIEQLLSNFTNAVDAYDVNGMMNCLSDTGFSLTITEAGLSYPKNKTNLNQELIDDQANQLAWRKSSTDDPVNGHGYVLDLRLGTPGYSNETSTGAIVTQTFQVWESATSPPIGPKETDLGNITWQLTKTNGTWKAVAMTIEYQTLSSSALSVSGTGKPSGFGFSRLSL